MQVVNELGRRRKPGEEGKQKWKPLPQMVVPPRGDGPASHLGWGLGVPCPGDSSPSALRQSWVEPQTLSHADGEDHGAGRLWLVLRLLSAE